MNFLQTIFANLQQFPTKPILQQIRDGQFVTTSSQELLRNIERARRSLRRAGLSSGDCCVLLAPNSSRWVALNLAIMAEGAIAVPLYSRQAPDELVSMAQDCSPRVICCGNEEFQMAVRSHWPSAPLTLLFDQIFEDISKTTYEDVRDPSAQAPIELKDDAFVTIIYTSGTSGEAKGAVLNVGNVNFMLGCTTARLGELMQDVPKEGDDRVFHYLPFCFAGSWIMLLTCLFRNNCLMMSTDLNKLADELKVARPHYFLNVPALLERIRTGINAQLRQKGGLAWVLFHRAQAGWLRQQRGDGEMGDKLCVGLAGILIFPKIKQRVGPGLRALICGSAPLAEDTQFFFRMIGIPVLQVYGLTETTAICTMDDVKQVTPGRVGQAILGVEMKLGENEEILVRGPNVFAGYWKRPQATSEILRGGWLHTGDQGHVDEHGNWKIIGRLKNLIVISGGHNISPEPIEQMVLSSLPETEQVLVVGNGKKFLSVIITGEIPEDRIHAALESVNRGLPHYKQIRRFLLSPEGFMVENGLRAANGKLRRPAIEARFREEIERLYQE